MDKVYLAPCPFCAGGAKKDEFDSYYGYQDRNTAYYVRCRECGAEVQADSYDEAVKKWNRRAAKMTAREYIDISYRMFREDDRAWDELVACEANDPEKAIMMVKRWTQEHPEERSE